ncbi:unnamed protein product [Dibothriocephalus latus]|uniref:Uncharacterized protein n=1 Tax=Dibothriocephalus latus TaxID=60516 RepID=A0A3P7L896_DIBLA|nr:unnamed protein product [Dibothriocephalus latus]
MMPEVSRLTYPERCKALDMFTLGFRRSRGDQIMMYKMIVCNDILEVAQFFKQAGDMPTRGHCYKLVVLRTNGCPHIFGLLRSAVNAWNNPPPDVVAADTVASFKKNYDALFEF